MIFGWEFILKLYFCFVVTFGYDNLSSFKKATQSSRNNDTNASPARAVDRDITTCSSTGADNPAWWYVDLEEIKSIHDIQVYFYGTDTANGCDSPGTYGDNCFQRCPSKCQEQRCHIINGTCLGCTEGWKGDKCEYPCPEGYYGFECRPICSNNCLDNRICNHVTGYCDNGCFDGWSGGRCNI
ncbi:multiple epidermal growth factor-like domains protein 10, partial [Saccostrea cucullata]|uniref:multiple epidermal growth factor-like domains protein 10 n=1 Tax=Saccostrea cuccullata TaxID=36930 RepID=UPI002ED6A27D